MKTENKNPYLATHLHAPDKRSAQASHQAEHDDHEHHLHIKKQENKLMWPFLITLTFALVEAFGGWLTNSLALIGDAGHMVSDASALGLAVIGAHMAAKLPSEKYSYGLVRAEVLIALINVMLMLAVVIYILVEAVERIQTPQPVQGAWVMLIAFIGLLVNLVVLKFLNHHHDNSNLNTRAAILHVTGDLLGSVAAIAAGAVIYFTGWLPIDPILSIVLSCLILFSTFNLLREVINVLMEAVPNKLSLVEVGDAMSAIEGVISVHDVHIWQLSSSVIGLTSHVKVSDLKAWQQVLPEIREMLHERFGIDHVTLQPEIDASNCHA